MQFHMWILFVAGLVPLITGFIWYNPKVFGNAWMASAGLNEDKLKGTNMPLVFGLCYLFGCMLAMLLWPIVIHQMGFMSSLEGEPGIHDATSEISKYAQQYYDTYGTRFHTFKHGAFHGILTAIFASIPIIGTSALFERKGFKYIAIHVGYWMLTLALMGGLVCQFIQ